MKKNLLKYSGIFILLTGVLFIVFPYFMKFQTNATLFTGWLLIVAGFVLYIVINKKVS